MAVSGTSRSNAPIQEDDPAGTDVQHARVPGDEFLRACCQSRKQVDLSEERVLDASPPQAAVGPGTSSWR